MTEHDALNAEEIQHGLKTSWLGRRVECLTRVASTNDVVKSRADAGAAEGLVVFAEEQERGRGRLGRSWAAPPRSSILMSLLLRPKISPARVPLVTMAVALGACDGISEELGLAARCKWPNDVMVSGRKCGGILAEAQFVGGRVDYVVVGLGLNVNFRASGCPDLPPTATSLSDALGRETPRAPLARRVLEGIEKHYNRLLNGENLAQDFAARSAMLGQPVTARTPRGEERGLAERIDGDGALWLRRADGASVRLIAGDVTLNGY